MNNLSFLSSKCEVCKKNEINKYGVFAKKNINKNELIAVWGGYIYTMKEFQKLPSPVSEYPVQVSDKHFIGTEETGNYLDDCERFNHSCDANAGIKGQILLIARKNIKKGEEVCIDYETINTTDTNFICDCGSKDCRKRIKGNSWKKPAFQKKYKGYFSYYLEEKIKKLKHKK